MSKFHTLIIKTFYPLAALALFHRHRVDLRLKKPLGQGDIIELLLETILFCSDSIELPLKIALRCIELPLKIALRYRVGLELLVELRYNIKLIYKIALHSGIAILLQSFTL